MTKIDDLPIDLLIGTALAEVEDDKVVDALRFRAASVDDRLAEIDELFEGSPVAALAKASEAGPPPALAWVPAPLRALPGGDAFDALYGPEVLAMAVGPLKRARDLYRRVRAFLARLRDGVFGFRRELIAEPALRLTVASSLDSDVEVDVECAAISRTGGEQIAAALAAAGAAIDQALAMFAKVVEIVATIIKAATSPVGAVRALWRALTGLHDLLAAHFAAQPAPA